MAKILLTYDLEFPERSLSGFSIDAEVIKNTILKPLQAQVMNCIELNIKHTIFVEINQFLIIKRYYPESWSRILDIINKGLNNGCVRLGLHVHPNWDELNGAKWADKKVIYGEQTYDYVIDCPERVSKTWVQGFYELFHNSPIYFRAGKYRKLPNCLKLELIKLGVKFFSTEKNFGSFLTDNGNYISYECNSITPVTTLSQLGYANVLINDEFSLINANETNVKIISIDGILTTIVDHQKDWFSDEVIKKRIENLQFLNKHFDFYFFEDCVPIELNKSYFRMENKVKSLLDKFSNENEKLDSNLISLENLNELVDFFVFVLVGQGKLKLYKINFFFFTLIVISDKFLGLHFQVYSENLINLYFKFIVRRLLYSLDKFKLINFYNKIKPSKLIIIDASLPRLIKTNQFWSLVFSRIEKGNVSDAKN